MQRTLTAKEITDIIFQKPERITAGILDRISLFERLENAAIRRERPIDRYPYRATEFDDYKIKPQQRLQLTFNGFAKHQGDNHPQSFVQAKKELKAIGLSHKQILFIFDSLEDVMQEIKGVLGISGLPEGHVAYYDENAYLGWMVYDNNLHHMKNGQSYFSPEDNDETNHYGVYLEVFESLLDEHPNAFKINSSKSKRLPQLK